VMPTPASTLESVRLAVRDADAALGRSEMEMS